MAVDFRAGLALLPYLPMSPGDVKLIFAGFKRRSLVQFDRGDLNKLSDFVQRNSEHFADMAGMLDELKKAEEIYRNSQPDITHNLFRLLGSKKLWSQIFESAVGGWQVRNFIDNDFQSRLSRSRRKVFVFAVLGFLPILGGFFRKLWGRSDWRGHYKKLMSSFDYFKRAARGKLIEKAIGWHSCGRISDGRAEKISDSFPLFLFHLPFSILPVGLGRFLTDWQFAKEKLAFICVRPVKLYFNKQMREQWLRDMVNQGRAKHILTDEDSATILSQLNEPYIQKYLVSLVVHIMTLPITQIVSLAVAGVYYFMHPEMPQSERALAVGGILILFQIIPISPGSITRGLYTLGLAVKERNFKDYNIAVFLSFFKYVGYLAFPIQMVYHYPALARFMAGHWATEAVHIVPVFGERGALLEHTVFCWFYNWPLTVRKRMRIRAEARKKQPSRYWHIGLCAAAGAIVLGLVDYLFLENLARLPGMQKLWWVYVIVPFVCGGFVTAGAGGLKLFKRIIAAAAAAAAMGACYLALSVSLAALYGLNMTGSEIFVLGVWRVFVFSILAVIGVIFTELKLPEPTQWPD